MWATIMKIIYDFENESSGEYTVQKLMDAMRKLEEQSANARTDVVFQVAGCGVPLEYQLEWFYNCTGFKYLIDTKGVVYDKNGATYSSLDEAEKVEAKRVRINEIRNGLV